jgi:hypothetical protein
MRKFRPKRVRKIDPSSEDAGEDEDDGRDVPVTIPDINQKPVSIFANKA